MQIQFDITEEINEQVENLLWRFQQENPGKQIDKDHVLNMCIDGGIYQVIRNCNIAGYKLERERFSCPVCNEGPRRYRNLWRSHWFYCEKCKVTWLEGTNLFSDWREETEYTWRDNELFLRQFRTIEL